MRVIVQGGNYGDIVRGRFVGGWLSAWLW